MPFPSTYVSPFFRRSLFLYLVVGIILILSVNPQTAYMNRLNQLKGIEFDLYGFSNGEGDTDRERLLLGIRYYKELLKINNANAGVYGDLGFCYFYLGDYQTAIRLYKKAISLEPKLYTYHWDLAMIYFYLKEYSNVVPYLQNCITQIPATISYYMGLGRKIQEKGEEQISRLIYFLLMRADKDEAEAYERLLFCYSRVKEYKIMQELAHKGLQLHPDNERILYYAGLANFLSQNYEDAITYFNKAIELDRKDMDAYYYRGLCFQNLNRPAQYFQDMQKVLALHNAIPQAEQANKVDIRLHLNSDIQSLQIHADKQL